MMRMKTKTSGLSQVNVVNVGGGHGDGGGDWEMRPGGMLVQKRNPDLDRNVVPPPTIRVRVKYGSVYHQIHISSQASFGELKKMLTGPTGLHHEDQKLMYKDKERDSKTFLDLVGVKDRSKMVLVEDPMSQERRFHEMRKKAKLEKMSKIISEISLEIDKLGRKVSALETIILKGAKVVEKDLLNIIELLMNQLIKLDGIVAEGDVKLQRKMQVKRVQKYVETLDVLKIKNSSIVSNNNNNNNNNHIMERKQQQQQQEQERHSTSGVVVTTKWETFDSAAPFPVPAHAASPTDNLNHQKFIWDLFE